MQFPLKSQNEKTHSDQHLSPQRNKKTSPKTEPMEPVPALPEAAAPPPPTKASGSKAELAVVQLDQGVEEMTLMMKWSGKGTPLGFAATTAFLRRL